MNEYSDAQSIEFLNYIYQNARMGIVSINKLIEKEMPEDILKVLKKQLAEYEKIVKETTELFIKYNKVEKDISTMSKISTYMMINMKIKNKTNECDKIHTIAKMMMEGSNKGIIQINEKLNDYNNCDGEVIELANKLLEMEKHNLEEFKKYL